MGAPVPETNAVEDVTVETLLGSLRTIDPGERRKHASVYNYWLSIKTDREFPPIRDLDPLEISDAGPFSVLLEMVGGGEDAGVRHLGHAIRGGVDAKTVNEAPNPSLLSCIAKRLPVVAATRDAFAFEDQFETDDGKVRCWVTLLPFSATGTWIDYVYGFVSLGGAAAAAEDSDAGLEIEPTGDLAEVLKLADELAEADAAPVSETVEPAPEIEEPEGQIVEPEPEPEEIAQPVDEIVEDEPVEPVEPAMELSEEEPEAAVADEAATAKPKFSARFFETLVNVGGFHGRPVKVELDPSTVSLETWDAEDPAEADEAARPEPEAISDEEPVNEEEAVQIEEPAVVDEPEPVEEVAAIEPVAAEEPPVAEEAIPVEEPVPNIPTPSAAEGSLQSKLTDVRAKADEARQAKLRANAALYEGLSAAYDFALDAETAPEEYLKLVEAEGIKIQLRSPMKPVAKLAFDGMCDEATIKQLEAILAWAFEEELPRGTLAGRIEEAGGIGPILSGEKRAA